MKALWRNMIALSYATSEALSETASTGSTIFVTFNNVPLASRYIISSTIAVTTGIIHWITNYYFQGTVIKDDTKENIHLLDEEKSDLIEEDKHSEIEEENDAEEEGEEEQYSYKKACAYLAAKYGYLTVYNGIEFGGSVLTYSATKAWIYDLLFRKNIALSNLAMWEVAAIAAYFLPADWVFFMTNEGYEVTEHITEHFKFPKGKRPDEKFCHSFLALVRPFAGKERIRDFVQIFGSIADTVEHIIPLILLIPPSWILALLEQSAFISVPVIGIFSVLMALISATILGQTFFFEGHYSAKNLLEIAKDPDMSEEYNAEVLKLYRQRDRFIPTRWSNIAHYLLYLPGIVHGFDAALSIILSLRFELELSTALAYSAGAAVFFASWVGNTCSEVKESQKELKKITKTPYAQLLLESRASEIFKPIRKYGTHSQRSSSLPLSLITNDSDSRDERIQLLRQ